MKKFQFKMDKILDLRKFQQQQAEIELGKANAEVARIQAELDSIAQNRIRTIKAFDQETDFAVQAQIQQYFFVLDQKKEKFLEEIAQAQMIADEKREIVRECMKKTKVLENLKEKQRLIWKKQVQNEEEVDQDDLASARANSAMD
ncbi:MAG: flagellar export protein FliJ [Treponema sp.]|nr:flagellar export protein FliJ [Treponema sp.]